MHWNYRIIKDTYEERGRKYIKYSIHEVHYNEAGEIWAMTEDPVSLDSIEHEEDGDDALESLKWTLNTILKDIEKRPILEEPIKFAKCDHPPSERSEKPCNAQPVEEKE